MAKSKRNKSYRGRKKPTSSPESTIVLDNFSEADLRTWKKVDREFTSYSYAFFAQLEAQRAAVYDDILESLRSSTSKSIDIVHWCRTISYKYSLEPLSSKGSLTFIGGRFNYGRDINPIRFPAFPGLYLASNAETAFREKFGLEKNKQIGGLTADELNLQDNQSYSSLYLKGEVNNLFDLSQVSNLKAFVEIIKNFTIPKEVKEAATALGLTPPTLIAKPGDLKRNLLGSDWRKEAVQVDHPSNTQIFGKIIRDAGFEGIYFPSSKKSGDCIVVFPENLENSSSYIELEDEPPEECKIIRLDKNTYKESY